VATETASGSISAHALDINAVTDSKIYDASTSSTLTPSTSGLQGTDSVTGLSQSFDTKNAGSRTLSVGLGFTVNDGNGGGNYSVTPHTATGSISAHALDINAVTDSKIYDATTVSTKTPTSSGLQGTDSVTGLSQSFDFKNAGSRTLSVNAGYVVVDGNGGGNYTVTPHTATGTITPALPAVAVTWNSWVLDGTAHLPTATVTGPVSVENPIGSPAVTFTYYAGTAASGTALASAPSTAGTYTVSASFPGSMNYAAASMTKTISITYAASGTCNGEPGHQILQPINADGMSVFKQGSTVPAKFRVCDNLGASIGTPGVVMGFNLIQRISGIVSTTVNEAVVSTTPDSAFRWDSTAQQWIFNVNTRGLSPGTTYVYAISLNDGSTISFQFGLK
jgi:trimeric autotransporter adhesin